MTCDFIKTILSSPTAESDNVKIYYNLLTALFDIRKANGRRDSYEEDRILDEMDDLWHTLNAFDMEKVRAVSKKIADDPDGEENWLQGKIAR